MCPNRPVEGSHGSGRDYGCRTAMQDLRSEYHTLFGYFLDDFWFRFEAVDPASYCGRSMLLAPISAPISPAGLSRTDL
ncbi:hypothetical protein SLE2022_351410 [Rubroshorea leprosula]